MNPYRTQSIILGPRWNVSFWRKLYVRIVRKFINLREQYSYQRDYNQYLRDLRRWQEEQYNLLKSIKQKLDTSDRRLKSIEYLKRSPRPLPPPIRICE